MAEKDTPLSGEALVKKFAAVFAWQGAIGMHITMQPAVTSDRALQLYNTLTKEQKSKSPGSKGLATAVKNISVLTGLRLKANQSTKKIGFP